MKLAILANEASRQEWLAKPQGNAEIVWANDVDQLVQTQADAWFDLDFEDHPEHIEKLCRVSGPVCINSVIHPLVGMEALSLHEDCQLVRMNAWGTFLKREITELCIADPFDESVVREIFGALGWKYWIVPDVPGMVTPRVISAIINEAYFTLQADVSTKEEIDTAMKLGTNYPFGPFEWSRAIGLKKIYELLLALSKTDSRYLPAARLQEEVN